MKYNYKELAENIALTENAINFIVQNFDPVSYTDFTGYIMDIGVLYPDIFEKRCFCLAVTQDGKFQIFPFAGATKKLTKRAKKRIITVLYDTLFIDCIVNEPFLEYSNIYNLPINPEKTHFFEERLLKEIKK